MLKHTLIHPEINAVLGRAGHHGKILIADGNYPSSTKRGPNAVLVSLNLSPGEREKIRHQAREQARQLRHPSALPLRSRGATSQPARRSKASRT